MLKNYDRVTVTGNRIDSVIVFDLPNGCFQLEHENWEYPLILPTMLLLRWQAFLTYRKRTSLFVSHYLCRLIIRRTNT